MTDPPRVPSIPVRHGDIPTIAVKDGILWLDYLSGPDQVGWGLVKQDAGDGEPRPSAAFTVAGAIAFAPEHRKQILGLTQGTIDLLRSNPEAANAETVKALEGELRKAVRAD